MKKKVMIIFISLILIIVSFPLISRAELDTSAFKGVTEIQKDAGAITDFAGDMYFAIRVFCTGLAVVTCILQGIRYMTSSVEDKAQIKQQMVPLFVGIGALFLVSTIAVTVANLASSILD